VLAMSRFITKTPATDTWIEVSEISTCRSWGRRLTEEGEDSRLEASLIGCGSGSVAAACGMASGEIGFSASSAFSC